MFLKTLGSLFDGSAQRAGITPIWASEIEPFDIRVTCYIWARYKNKRLKEKNLENKLPQEILQTFQRIWTYLKKYANLLGTNLLKN